MALTRPPDVSAGATGGFTCCGHPDCYRMVAPAEGFCSEHKKSAPRVYLTPRYQSRNLDDELENARREYERAKAKLETAERDLRETEAAVAQWDKAHAE